MTDVLIAIAGFVVAIALLVTIHEFGHFWVARRLGIKVLRFSIGFGRPLWSRRSGPDETEFVIAAIPLGGYVKMLDEREGPVAAADVPRAFNRQPVPSRMAVLVAGPAFNFIFAIAAYWMIFVLGVPGLRPVVADVEPGSYAAQAGLVAMDEIVAVGDRETATWEAAMTAMLQRLLDNEQIPMRVRAANGSERELTVTIGDDLRQLTEPGQLFPGLGIAIWSPDVPARIGELVADGPAARSGLHSSDLVVSADGQPIASWSAFVDVIRARPNETLQIEIERAGARMPLALEIGSADEEGVAVGRIGAGVEITDEVRENMRAERERMISEQKFGWLAAVPAAAEKTWDMSVLTLRMFWSMIRGDVSAKNISGPISIAQYAGVTISIGLVPFLSFLAIVSLSLGLINLLPIPMLDGGQLVYQGIELLKGSPVSERIEIVGQQVGIVMLLLLMSFAFYNDIARLIG